MRILATFCFLACLSLGARAELTWRPLGEPGSGGWLTGLRVNPKDPAHLVLGGDMLGIGVSRDGGKTWTGGYGLPSWEIGDLTFDPTNPDVVWAGTMSGPVVSRDGGVTWTLQRKGFPEVSGGLYSAPIQRVLIDPENPARLLAFAGTYRGWESPGSPKHGFIWESLDGGANWQEFSSIRPFRNISWVDADAAWKRLYAVVIGRGVHTSEDRGKTWQPANDGLPPKAEIRMVAAHPSDPDVAWVAVANYADPANAGRRLAGGIFRTDDGGRTWRSSSDGLAQEPGKSGNHTSGYQAVAVSPANPNHLITSDVSWTHNAVYRSSDGGKSWEKVLDSARQRAVPVFYPAGFGATVAVFCPTEPSMVYLGNSETVLKSIDLGATWQDITASPVDPETRRTWRGHGYSGLCSTGVFFNPFRPDSVVLTAMDAAKHLRSDDGRRGWFLYDKGFAQPWGGGNDCAFAKPDGSIAYLAVGQHGGQGAIARTDDWGRTWREFKGREFGLPGTAEVTAVHCDPDQPDRAWAVMGRKFFATEDGGKSWKENPDLAAATTIGRPAGAGFPFYVGTAAGIYRTEDGKSFALLSGSPASPVRIHVPAANPESPLAVRHRAEKGGAFQKTGESWVRVFDNTYAFDIAVHPKDPGRMAVITHDDPYRDVSGASGVWITTDSGKTWQQANKGLSCLRGKSVAFDPHRPDSLIVGTFGRGFFEAEWPDL